MAKYPMIERLIGQQIASRSLDQHWQVLQEIGRRMVRAQFVGFVLATDAGIRASLDRAQECEYASQDYWSAVGETVVDCGEFKGSFDYWVTAYPSELVDGAIEEDEQLIEQVPDIAGPLRAMRMGIGLANFVRSHLQKITSPLYRQIVDLERSRQGYLALVNRTHDDIAKTRRDYSGASIGAMVGSLFGPLGALIGAGVGASEMNKSAYGQICEQIVTHLNESYYPSWWAFVTSSVTLTRDLDLFVQELDSRLIDRGNRIYELVNAAGVDANSLLIGDARESLKKWEEDLGAKDEGSECTRIEEIEWIEQYIGAIQNGLECPYLAGSE